MYHTILVCKYRKDLLLTLNDQVKNIFLKISSHSDFEITEIETDKNHIHLLVKSEPKVSPLQIIRKLKQLSTIYIWAANSNLLKKHFWKENTFWSDGYFISSIGNASKETIEHYIQNQG